MSGKSHKKPDLACRRKTAMLGMLRDARAIVYRKAEALDEAAAVLEHIGQMELDAVRTGLDGYKHAIFKLARKAPAIQCERVELLFDTVRQARNDSVHTGDFIRHHTTRLVELLLLVEEGLSMSAKTAGDLMVQNPTTAELWHNISAVRRAMLTNSFSFLPVQDKHGVWKLLSDVSVVRYLKRPGNKDERGERLGKQIGKALDDGEITLTDCDRLSKDKNLEDIMKAINHAPVLIVDKDGNKERLIGILTAFDLL